MKTKIVYVVSSLFSDTYFEQAYVSAWSARQFTKEISISLVCDNLTKINFDSTNRKEKLKMFDEVILVNFEESIGMLERSRWMKTNLRNLVKGDFLYLDTDTIVCGDLSFVDDFEFDLGMVLENNTSFSNLVVKDLYIDRQKKVFNYDLSNVGNYYNGGVFYVKDTEKSYIFFNRWHQLWKSKCHEREGYMLDQHSLIMSDIELDRPIKEMTGNLNCQVLSSLQYLHTASILHIYRTWSKHWDPVLPFCNEDFYREVRTKDLSDEKKDQILRCKEMFISPSVPVPLSVARLLRTYYPIMSEYNKVLSGPSFYLLSALSLRPKILAFLDSISSFVIRLFGANR